MGKKKDEARAAIDLIFKPSEFVASWAEMSAKTEEERQKAKTAGAMARLLKETFQSLAELVTDNDES